MTGSPPGAANGSSQARKPNPNANPLRSLRKPRPAAPLVARKKPLPSRPLGSGQVKSAESTLEDLRRQYGGWSQPPPDGVQTFPVFTTKSALRKGSHYHVMRFVRARLLEDDKPVDPSDQDEFARPVTLHRRDPRQPPPGRVAKEEPEPEPDAMDDEEAEKLAQLKAEREAQRAIDQAKIAPVMKEAATSAATASKRNNNKKQKEERTTINRAPTTEEGKKESDIRYLEALPWHLEDADGKNIWVGSYVSALSEANTAVANVAFVIDRPGFRMIPLEKWYKFTSKPPFTPYSLDQAEALMNKKTDVGRWAMREQERTEAKKEWTETKSFLRGRAGARKRTTGYVRDEDREELDLSGDEFQDDDEAPNFEAFDNEDEKDAKARVRRDQLGANLWGEGDEREVEKEEEEVRREKEARRILGKKLKKALIKREHDVNYESDSSEDDPFASSSEDESSEDETSAQAGAEDESKSTTKPDSKDKSAAPTSKAASTTLNKQKPSETGKKKTLKRPGSPTLSESSGNESSRKKPAGPSGGQSRAMTPMQRPKAGAGATNDADGPTSELPGGPPTKRIKLGAGDGETPSTSRAGSPVPLAESRGAASPSTDNGNATPSTGPVEDWEIVEALPALPDGISIGSLMKMFQHRIGDRPGLMERKDWIKLVKDNAVWGPDKLLRRKAAP